jgi:hypothetical protein
VTFLQFSKLLDKYNKWHKDTPNTILLKLLEEWTLAKSYDINFKLRCGYGWKGQQGRVKIGGRRSGRTWPNDGPKHHRRRKKKREEKNSSHKCCDSALK